ncbi:MAG: hypothetical protein ACMG57_00885 [Candidatus Dojkabacteria bacterium]
MIKKLVLTIFFLFVAFGAVLPHSLNAATDSGVGGPVCGSGSPAGDAVFCVIDNNTNGKLGNDPEASDWGGILAVLGNSAIYFTNGTPYGALRNDIFKQTGKSAASLSQTELTAYFQQSGNTNSGISGLLSNLNAQLLDQRPASGLDFVNEKVYAITNTGKVSASTNPEPSTYYPGAGSELLRPIQAFWGWSVNLVFGFLVLLIIVIALAIMFRQRLGGAAEVTIQNAIPSIALAMILIPLSYAISGLFIDTITIGTNVVHGFLLGPQSPGAAVYSNRDNKDLVNCDLQNTDAGSATNCDRGLYADDPTIDVWRARARIDIRDAGTTLGQSVNNSLAGVPSAQAIFNLIGSILSIISSKNGQFSQYAWFGNIVNLIIGVLTIWIALKIFWKLLNKYFTLIIMPAFSPFIFATAALPGNGTKSIVSYLKTMGSAALFYIVTYAMFILTMIFTDPTFQASLPDFRTSGYIPPLLGIQAILKDLTTTASSFPLTQLLMTLVGLGIYFSIPKTLEGIDEALGTKFILPQLLKTPFESMQESFKIATRAFPAAAARTAQITAGGARGIAGTATNAGFNLRRARDRAFGIADSDPRSVVAQRKNANIQRRQKLLADLDAAEGKPVERARIQGELARLNISEGLQGKEFSTQSEEGKERSIKASFKWKGTEKFLILKDSEIKSIVAQSKKGAWDSEALGELTIEAENFTFPAKINPTDIKIGTVEAANKIPGFELLGTKEVFNTEIKGLTLSATSPASPSGASGAGFGVGLYSPFFGGSMRTDPKSAMANPALPPNSMFSLYVSDDASYNTENGKLLKLKMKLHVDNTNAFFEGTVPVLAIGFDIVSQKRAIKIGAYSSNPTQVLIQRVRD